jgi:hypothetical protein
MFDPTIFDNLKTVMEGAIYDLDLDNAVLVTGRQDTINLADMSRTFALRFVERPEGFATVEMRLIAELADMAGELLALPGEGLGCRAEIVFELFVEQPEACSRKVQHITKIWGTRPRVETTVSFRCLADGTLPESLSQYLCSMTLSFDRKIGEDQAEDLVHMVDYCHKTLTALNKDA